MRLYLYREPLKTAHDSIERRGSSNATSSRIEGIGGGVIWLLLQLPWVPTPGRCASPPNGYSRSTTLTFASSQPSACQPEVSGTNDYFSAPQASSDRKSNADRSVEGAQEGDITFSL